MNLDATEAEGGGDADVIPLPAKETLELITGRLARGSSGHLSDEARIDFLRAAEDLKNALAGAQAVVSVGLDASQRRGQAAAGSRPSAKSAGSPCRLVWRYGCPTIGGGGS